MKVLLLTPSLWLWHVILGVVLVQYSQSRTAPSTDTDMYSSEKEIRVFLKNNQYTSGIRANCLKYSMSCFNRCGSKIDDFPAMFNESYKSCSCDKVCPIYDDCCWDFSNTCRSEVNKYKHLINNVKSLKSTKVECNRGTAVITYDAGNISDMDNRECNEDRHQTDHCFEWEERDYRQPIMHLDGIQFQNASVYHHYLAGNIDRFRPVAWKIKLRSSFSMPHYELEAFLSEGKASEDTRYALENIPPEGVTERMCKAESVRVDCSKKDGTFASIHMTLSKTKDLCKNSLYWSESQSIYPTVSSSIGTTVSTTMGVYSTDSPDAFKSNCMAFYILSPRTNMAFLFSFLVSFSELGGVSIERFRTDEGSAWNSLKYIESFDGSKKQLVKLCIPGFLFNGDNCVVPETLLVRVVYHVSYLQSEEKYINVFCREITKSVDNTNFTLNRPSVDQHCAGYHEDNSTCRVIVCDAEYEFMSHNLSYNGTISPITESIIDQFQCTTNTTLSNLKQNMLLVTPCLVSDSTEVGKVTVRTENDKILNCARIFWDWDHESFSAHHFRVKKVGSSLAELDNMTIPFRPRDEQDVSFNNKKAVDFNFLLMVAAVFVCWIFVLLY